MKKTKLVNRIEELSKLRIKEEDLLVENESLGKIKHVKKMSDLEEDYNLSSKKSRVHKTLLFGVLIDCIFTNEDFQTNCGKFEIWKMSNFQKNPRKAQKFCLLFVSGDGLARTFFKDRKLLQSNTESEKGSPQKDSSISGCVVLIRKLRVLEGKKYNEFKDKYKKSRNGTLCFALHIRKRKDILFLGKCKDFARCSLDSFGSPCNAVVNKRRIGLYEDDENARVLCDLHRKQEMKKRNAGKRSMVASSKMIRTKSNESSYVNGVYFFMNNTLFLNFKGLKKMRRIQKREEKKEERDKQYLDFLEKRNTTLGESVVKYHLEKKYRNKIEEILQKKNKDQSLSEVKKTAMKIAKDGFVPKLGRGLKRNQMIAFDLSESEEESEYEPPRKKRKLNSK